MAYYTIEEAKAISPHLDPERLARFVAKCHSTPAKVQGWLIKVKTGKNSATTGTVVACEYLGLTGKGSKWVPVYKVTLQCGTAKALRTFNLSTFTEQRS